MVNSTVNLKLLNHTVGQLIINIIIIYIVFSIKNISIIPRS